MPQKLILSSSVNRVARDIVNHVDMSKNKLAFIFTSSEVEGGLHAKWNQDDRKALESVGFDIFDYTITDKTRGDVISNLSKADVLYFSGGNTYYLIEQARKANCIDVIKDMVQKQGKLYIGTSAGSIAAGPKLPEYLLDLGEDLITQELLESPAFNLVNFTILPHWGSNTFKDRYLESRLKTLYSKEQVPLILLTDSQYVLVENENFRIININETKD